jgi:hypothetical protein
MPDLGESMMEIVESPTEEVTEKAKDATHDA